MGKRTVQSIAALFLVAVMMTGSAWAQGRGRGMSAANQGWRSGNDRGASIDRDWRGDRDRWTFGNDQRPRGWEKGKKNGWGDCDVPPGQAKKMGCAPSPRVFNHAGYRAHRERRERDRDRDRDRDRLRRSTSGNRGDRR